jgi:hypothetical protein
MAAQVYGAWGAMFKGGIAFMSRKLKFLSAAVGVAALLLTLTRTLHTHAVRAEQANTSTEEADQTPIPRFHRNGNFVCPPLTFPSDCEIIIMTLPMSMNEQVRPLKLPAVI